MADYEEKLTSDYNEAAFQISRLQNIKLECEHARTKGKLILYKWKLQSFEVELCADILRIDDGEEDEEKTYTKKLEDLNKSISDTETSRNFNNFFQELVKKEKLLRVIQEEAGKGSRLRPSDDDGI